MYNSKEIRWFYKTEPESIRNWFEENGYIFENTEARTDYYLPLKDKNDLSIKLRENNIEVKQRTGRSENADLTDSIQGYFEDYTKWSFSSAEDDSLFHEITEKEKFSWLPVKKERIGFKLKKDDHDKIVRVALEEFPPYGCQLEYTRVKVKDEIWYSFALEWFGDQELEFDLSILDEIIGEHKLEASDSMGYAEFLNKF
ncbi:hypothetical protein C8P64_1391 [Christiangramia gaetbulicola]|uniref:CYTH domain-containing protein n=1 Tax=Christiangramia gaetbulicola TaxID=703340 RepID=A0A2T6AGE0_9FLAO|nr:hypothetical protein [Christiangramia gaetbulicola]PTX42869.1 hypothetical protein C8P64_1391 [Christiangramia gaetbulicola]